MGGIGIYSILSETRRQSASFSDSAEFSESSDSSDNVCSPAHILHSPMIPIPHR